MCISMTDSLSLMSSDTDVWRHCLVKLSGDTDVRDYTHNGLEGHVEYTISVEHPHKMFSDNNTLQAVNCACYYVLGTIHVALILNNYMFMCCRCRCWMYMIINKLTFDIWFHIC